MSNLDNFISVYEMSLLANLAANPSNYAYGPDDVSGLMAKMRAQMLKLGGGSIMRGPTRAATCKALGIKDTDKAINAYLDILTPKKLDAAISAGYGPAAEGREINVLDIPKLYAEVRAAYAVDPCQETIDAALAVAVEKYTRSAS